LQPKWHDHVGEVGLEAEFALKNDGAIAQIADQLQL